MGECDSGEADERRSIACIGRRAESDVNSCDIYSRRSQDSQPKNSCSFVTMLDRVARVDSASGRVDVRNISITEVVKSLCEFCVLCRRPFTERATHRGGPSSHREY